MLKNYPTKNLFSDYDFKKGGHLMVKKTSFMNLRLIIANFHSIQDHKSEEGFSSNNLVLRQVDAF